MQERSVSTSLRQVASEFSVEDLLSPLSGLADAKKPFGAIGFGLCNPFIL
jgi:hypothetical protein